MYPHPVWQDARSLELIRNATTGRGRADALAVYLTLTEHSETTLDGIARQTGLPMRQIEKAVGVLAELDLIRDGLLIA